MNLRGLIILALAVCLCTTTAQAVKMDGEIRSIDGQLEVGWARFDISAIPDGDTVTSIDFNFYVNATNYPYWAVTPMSNDPLTADGPTLWADITAEIGSGAYNYQLESDTYAPGWKVLTLGGNAAADLQANLGNDWFPCGIVDTDGYNATIDWFVEIDGRTDANPPYLVVTHTAGTTTCNPTAAPYSTGTTDDVPTGACCFGDGSCSDLTAGECAAQGGLFEGLGTECATTTCSTSDCNDGLIDLGTLSCSGSTTVTGDTTGNPNSCGNASGDAHYSFTLTVPASLTFTTCNAATTYDTYLRLYSDDCCGAEIAYNDDDPSCAYTYRSTLTQALIPGDYYLMVEGYSGLEGYYELEIICTASGSPDTVSLVADEDCYQLGDSVTVNIDLTAPSTAIVGGQFFLQYDNTALDFEGFGPGSDPFDDLIYQVADEGAGTLDVAVGVPASHPGATTDTTMVVLTFTALQQICAETGLVAFRPHNPSSRLSDYYGQPVDPALLDLDIVDTTPPVLNCPANVVVECDQSTEPDSGWDPKMHFPQEPNPTGWDINADYDEGRIVADDWLCTETGDLDRITIWGSWRGDAVGSIPVIGLWIAPDVPAGVDAPYSHPDTDNLLWAYTPYGGEFTVTEVFPSSDQGWFDPLPPEIILDDHQRYFRYDITIPPGSAFAQTDGTIYWLMVSAITEPDGIFWGMKTSTTNWNDNAVYYDPGNPVDWDELVDPVTSDPLDLAFIVGSVSGVIGQATATDNCDPAPVVTWSDSIAPGACPQEQAITRTWTATDHCGNSVSCVQTITVVDTTPPTLTCPGPVSVQCTGDIPAIDTGSVAAADNCDPAPLVTHVGDVSDGMSCPETITRTYRATDACGNWADCTQLITVHDTMPPAITCPDDITVNADAGGCSAIVSWMTPVASDNCDPSPAVFCVPASGSGFSGTTTVTCTATDFCGNTNICTFDVTVLPYNDLTVTLELSPTINTDDPFPQTLTRCITFELWDCGIPSGPTVLQRDVTFDVTQPGGPGTPILAVGTAAIDDVPCGLYTCITARDELHTLRRTMPVSPSGTGYVADFATALKPLIGGNFNDDEWIDILDFGIFSWQQFTNYGSGDTPCVTAYAHADVSGDGLVDTDDFSFIQINFLEGHEANCCTGGYGASPKPPVTSITVEELHKRGLGELAVADFNGDGVLDTTDITVFMGGQYLWRDSGEEDPVKQ